MGLYERWTATDDTKLRIHVFAAATRELARGNITRQQVIDGFNLAGDDVTNLDAIAATYAALPNQAAKDRFIVLLEDVMIASEAGFYNRATAASRLGFT